MSLNDIHKFKKAKVLTKELEHIVSIINNAVLQLENYKKYIVVRDSVDMLKESKQMLEIHIKTQKLIIENKGLIE